MQPVGVYLSNRLGVDYNQVSIHSRLDPALSRQAEDPGRTEGERIHQPLQADEVLLDRHEHQRQHGLHARNAGRSLPDIFPLLLRQMWGMIRGQDVDRAGAKSPPEGVVIRLSPERRVHLEKATLLLVILIVKQQVMGSHLCGYGWPRPPGFFHRRQPLGRAEVADMQAL